MTSFCWTETIEGIHASGHKCVIAATGGGSTAIGRLLEVPGGSRTVLEAVVPYALPSLEEWIGGKAEQACSEQTARDMAMSAWMRARDLAWEADPLSLVGIGVTASLASSRPKRGDHRVHLAMQTATTSSSLLLTLDKGARDRLGEEHLVADMLLTNLAKICGVATSALRVEFLEQLSEGERVRSRHKQAPSQWTELLLGHQDVVREYPGGSGAEKPVAILPGSFNPPHQGHIGMTNYAAQKLTGPVCFELSITNVDKPPLDFLEIDERVAAIRKLAPEARVLLTNAPTFRKKSALFPGCTFLVGADTMARIADPQYYTQPTPDGSLGLEAAIAEIAKQGCIFWVYGRELEGDFHKLNNLDIPESLKAISRQVLESDFREDVSSTEIREKQLDPD